MATLCQKCGCIGHPELLIYCLVCKISAEHRYCLDRKQIEEETEDFIKWTCYECFQKASKIDPRISLDETKDKIRFQDVRVGCAAAVSLKRRCKNSKRCSLKKARKLFLRQHPGEDVKKSRDCSFTKLEENRGAASLEKRCNCINNSRLCLGEMKDEIRRQNVRESRAAAVSLERRCKDSKCCSLKKAEKLLFSRQPPGEDFKTRVCSLTKVEKNRGAAALEERCNYINDCSLGKADKPLISRHPQNESSSKEGHGSLQNIEKEKGLVPFTAEEQKQKRRLILADDDSCDEESAYVKTGWDRKVEEATNGNAIPMRKPVGSSSSGTDSGCAVERLQSIFGASESSSKEGHGSLQNIEKEKSLVSFTAEKQKQKRRLILADDDSCDGESTYVKTGLDCEGEEAADGNVIAMRKTVASSSSGADSGCAVERLQSIFGASDFCNPALNISYDRLASNCHNYVHAQPIIHPIWRGWFNICNSTYGMIAAHLSTKACSRVSEGANMLPPVLRVEKLQRTSAWPKAFKSSPPTDDHIGLYFLPEQFCDCSDGVLLNQLVCEVNDRDLVLKVTVEEQELELLIFSSQLLPRQDSTFQGKCYFWGVFRPRQKRLPNMCEAVVSDPIYKVSALSLSCVEDQEKNLPMKRRSSSPQTSHGNGRLDSPCTQKQSLGKQFHSGNESDDAVEAPDMNLAMMEARATMGNDDEAEKDGAELELFPLAVEDMAITARIGGMSCFDLDLGLGLGRGRSTSDGGAIRLKTKPDSLALDKEIF